MPKKMPPPLLLHYARLGLNPGASRAQLGAAYRAAALKYHPDRGGDATSFAAIQESYEAILATSRPAYSPASMHSHAGPAAAGDWADMWGIMGAVILPSAVGLAVGIRLMYTGADRSGLRAGGTSRVVVREDGTVESFGDARLREKREHARIHRAASRPSSA